MPKAIYYTSILRYIKLKGSDQKIQIDKYYRRKAIIIYIYGHIPPYTFFLFSLSLTQAIKFYTHQTFTNNIFIGDFISMAYKSIAFSTVLFIVSPKPVRYLANIKDGNRYKYPAILDKSRIEISKFYDKKIFDHFYKRYKYYLER